MSNIAPAPAANIPDWKVDANSPIKASSGTISGSPGGTYDEYLLEVRFQAPANSDVLMTLNGATDFYDYKTEGDSITTSANEWLLTPSANVGRGFATNIRFFTGNHTEFDDDAEITAFVQSGTVRNMSGGSAVQLMHPNQSDVNSFEIKMGDGTSISGKAIIMGRNL